MFVVGAVALATYALHGFSGLLTRDLSVYSYAGQQVADGVPPYVGILNRAGPLAHVIPGIGVGIARLGDFDDVLTMRRLFWVIAALCVCAVYLLARDLFTSRLAGVASAATFLTFSGFVHYATSGPREKTPMTLFIVCALWAATRRRWFTAGVFVSLATLCLQIAFPASFAAVVAAALVLEPGGRLRALGRIALGGAVPVAVCGVWFALAGSLRQSIDAFYVINARYTTPNPVLDELDTVWLDARTAYGLSLWLLFGGLVALIALALAGLRKGPGRTDVVLAAFSVGVVVGLLWNLKDYDAWPDLFPMLPFAAVGVGGLFALMAKRVSPRTAVAVTVAWSVAAIGVAGQYALSERNDKLVAQRESVAAVLGELPATARIISVEAPQPLVLSGRKNPTRHQMFRSGLQDYVEDIWPGGLDGYRRSIVARNPTLVSMGETVSETWRKSIQPEYVYIGRGPDWYWYARASLGEAKLAALRRATGYEPGD